VEFVAPVIGVPPEFELVLFEYHWYVGVPTPPVYETDNADGLPPTQSDCEGNGCVVMVGCGFTITEATLDVRLEQPPEDVFMIQ